MRPLSEYAEFLAAVLASAAEHSQFESQPPLEQIMKLPRLVVIFNHSTPLSWIPAISLLTTETVKAEGGDRTPVGIADKWFFSNPFTRPLAQYLTQSDRPLKLEELVDKLKNSTRTDLALMPEGANTFFGSVNEIHEFRSSRFIEIAVRCEAPLLLAVHRGSENWSLPVKLPLEWAPALLAFSKFFGEGLSKNGQLNLPLLPQKMKKFSMRCELYQTHLKLSDLENKSMLSRESEKIRQRMQSLFDDLG